MDCQLPLPSVDFAPEGVREFVKQTPTLSGEFCVFLEETADICVSPRAFPKDVVESAQEFYRTYFLTHELHTRTTRGNQAQR